MVNEDNIIYLPFDELTNGEDLCKVIKNAWWIVHPEKGLAFYSHYAKNKTIQRASPWYNKDKRIVDSIIEKHYTSLGLEARQIDLVIYRIDPREYC